MPRYRIDPSKFNDSQWSEMYYADGQLLLSTDRREDAKVKSVSRRQLLALISDVRAKSLSVLAGDLGESDEGDGVDIEEWGEDLSEAAGILEGLLI